MLDLAEFLKNCPMLEGRLHYFEKLESSNDTAIAMVRDGAGSGTLVLAESQTSGRGRGGNAWSCPKGEGLLFSLVLEPDIEKSLWPRLALAAGMAVAEAIEGYGVDTEIKWPNDVWINGRKCSGVLVEGCDDCVVVGVGLNVSTVQFPDEIKDSATSLMNEGLPMVSREVLLSKIITGLLKWCSRCGSGFADVVAAVNARCALRGVMIQLYRERELLTGKMVGISAEGYLLLERDDQVEEVVQADQVRKLGG